MSDRHPFEIPERPQLPSHHQMTPEVIELIGDYEQQLWDLCEQHLEAAVELARTRFHDSYARDFVNGVLDQIYGREGLVRPPNPGYRKRPIPQRLRTQVFERDAYRCRHCGGWEDLRADHVLPEVAGGETTLENLQTLCAVCNSKKGVRLPDQEPPAN